MNPASPGSLVERVNLGRGVNPASPGSLVERVKGYGARKSEDSGSKKGLLFG